eukprot:CAMPEP_0171142632 /NCGR_PEP_ID=MMETSP0766_2-20121228/142896_1 /TAXON_ID=439317 /ORGANISM="Gambierdiscus australes, Strain CAWD 149" /LENGTH=30 /DNA_ID= /DNA_START= /DNA_END= /DNA_ORIENTATION=
MGQQGSRSSALAGVTVASDKTRSSGPVSAV